MQVQAIKDAQVGGRQDSLNDSRGGMFLLLLLLLFVDRSYMSSHILYAVHISLLLAINRHGTFREIIGLFDPPVLSQLAVSGTHEIPGLQFVNCCMPCHILYTLYLFLCRYLI